MLLSAHPPIRHCRACGAEVVYRVPVDDNRERAVCPACGFYKGKKVLTGTAD